MVRGRERDIIENEIRKKKIAFNRNHSFKWFFTRWNQLMSLLDRPNVISRILQTKRVLKKHLWPNGGMWEQRCIETTMPLYVWLHVIVKSLTFRFPCNCYIEDSFFFTLFHSFSAPRACHSLLSFQSTWLHIVQSIALFSPFILLLYFHELIVDWCSHWCKNWIFLNSNCPNPSWG